MVSTLTFYQKKKKKRNTAHVWTEVVDEALAHDGAVIAYAVSDAVADDHRLVPDLVEREAAVDEALDRGHERLTKSGTWLY